LGRVLARQGGRRMSGMLRLGGLEPK